MFSPKDIELSTEMIEKLIKATIALLLISGCNHKTLDSEATLGIDSLTIISVDDIINTDSLKISESVSNHLLHDKWLVCTSEGCESLDPYYSDGVTVKWEGACSNGKANGYGKLIKYKNGELESTYEGDYKSGIREGQGKFIHVDGTISEGTFVNGQLMELGKATFSNNVKYIGNFVNYRCHGKGLMTWPNGLRFEGFFVSDQPYEGKYTSHNGQETFIQKGKPAKTLYKNSKSEYSPETGIQLIEYFNDNAERCIQDEASFYRVITYKSSNTPNGKVRDYFLSGQLRSEFTAVYVDYDDQLKNFLEGEEISYHENGKVKHKKYRLNNKASGTWTSYFSTGAKQSEIEFKDGLRHGIYQEWYKNGDLAMYCKNENGQLKDNSFFRIDVNGATSRIYVEDFSRYADEWALEDDVSYSEVNEEGKVSLSLGKDNIASRFNQIDLNTNSDYSIDILLSNKTHDGGMGYGLLFGHLDMFNHSSFLINEYGQYKIFNLFQGMEIQISDWKNSEHINTGNLENWLKVVKAGEHLYFSINGQVVERTSATPLRGNGVGIVASGKGIYQINQLILDEFVSTDKVEPNKMPKASNNDNWIGSGTGFFVSAKGHIATNYHVVEDATEIQVDYTVKGYRQVFNARVIASDKRNDLAILRIEDSEFRGTPPINYFFDSSTKDVGTDVFALGYPLSEVMGTEIKFTDGSISSKTGLLGDKTTYQISVPVQAGNSGGPLFDLDGNLVGIVSSRFNKDVYQAENASYAIKSSYLKTLIESMPELIPLPQSVKTRDLPLTEKIKALSYCTVLIRVK